jgi:hypothetical protein
MGRVTHTLVLLLALLTRAHAAYVARGNPPATPALSDTQVGGIVIGSLAFLCIGACWCAWCTRTNKTNEAFAHSQCCNSCAGLGGDCMV